MRSLGAPRSPKLSPGDRHARHAIRYSAMRPYFLALVLVLGASKSSLVCRRGLATGVLPLPYISMPLYLPMRRQFLPPCPPPSVVSATHTHSWCQGRRTRCRYLSIVRCRVPRALRSIGTESSMRAGLTRLSTGNGCPGSRLTRGCAATAGTFTVVAVSQGRE